jgi:hypothetical protein
MYDDTVLERAICAAAAERRWNDIDTMIEQYGRLRAAAEELRPFFDEHLNIEDRRAMRETEETDHLFERWTELSRTLSASGGDVLPDDVVERLFRLSRDTRHLLKRAETVSVRRKLSELDQKVTDTLADGPHPTGGTNA